ncbi:alpha/beta hydrolase [Rhodococcoides trifolii]|uniref:alpha/beta hydrolase n=1 Tax=Rhodococcoides trifolii TaxID=908250 RepID=UPI0035301D02
MTRYEFPSVSLQSKLLAKTLRSTVRPFLSVWALAPDLPWPMSIVDYAGLLIPPVDGTETASVRLEECNAEWIRPATRPARRADRDRVILYLHGGAFVTCGLRTHRRMTSRIAEATGADVLSVDYRMMPKNPISNAVSDGVDGYRYLLECGYQPEQIVIGGDSAGGYLAFMVALTLESQGLHKPAGVFTMSPLTDLDPVRKIEHSNARTCAVFPANAVPALTRLADRVDARIVVDGERGPRISPVDADLSSMPPTLIQVGSSEIVLTDAELMAHRLGVAGVECELQVWKDQVHVFQAADFLPESGRAIDEISAFVDSVVGRVAVTRDKSQTASTVG